MSRMTFNSSSIRSGLVTSKECGGGTTNLNDSWCSGACGSIEEKDDNHEGRLLPVLKLFNRRHAE